jgi:hypothetical protein
LPIEPLFGLGPDRPTSLCGVNGQLIDTVRLNGVYEMAPPYTCREAWLAAGQGPMRHTTASPALAARLASIAEALGPLPHAALDWSKRKKQTTRLLKTQCWCGYTVRVARTWVERVGPSHCPLHGPMAVEGGAQ